MKNHEKPLVWIGSSFKDLLSMPDDVQDVFGFALHLAQIGGMHNNAKALSGFGSAAVLEVIENGMGGTYRAVYTVRFKEAVFVLHCWQKKSKSGIATPKPDMNVIRERLKVAQAYAERMSNEKNNH